MHRREKGRTCRWVAGLVEDKDKDNPFVAFAGLGG